MTSQLYAQPTTREGEIEKGEMKKGEMERGEMKKGEMERGVMKKGEMERGVRRGANQHLPRIDTWTQEKMDSNKLPPPPSFINSVMGVSK